MALLKCPDCGKMVSERATSCPECGCPREYFEAQDEEKKVEKKKSEKTEKESAQKTKPKKEEEISFKIAGFTLFYPKGSEAYATLFGYYLHAADLAYEEMCKRYDNANGIGKALETIPDKAVELIYGVIDQGTKFLYQNGVNITPEQFMEKYKYKYHMDYSRFYDVTLEKYSEILDMKRELEAYRSAEKASRGRWQGGGFGVKGAIKGAVTASALNLGSDFLHSFGDSAKTQRDNQAVQGKLRALYRESKGQLCHSVKTCIMNVFEAMCDELDKIHFFEIRLPLNKTEADTLYENAKKYEMDPDEFKKKMILCIHTYPGDKRYYECFYEEWLNGDSQIKEFLEFWQLSYLLEDVIKEREDKDKFTSYIVEKGIESFDFSNNTAENVVVFLQMIQGWQGDIPNNGEWAQKIQAYIGAVRCDDKVIEEEILVDYLPTDLKVHEFIRACHRNQIIVGGNGLGQMWYYGVQPSIWAVEPSDKLMEKLVGRQDILCLYCDTSLIQNGSKGIAITSSYVIDLKNKLKLETEKIKEVVVEEIRGEQYTIRFSDGVNSIHFQNDTVKECRHSIYYLRNTIVAVLVRYGKNKFLKDTSSIPEEIKEVIEIDTEKKKKYFSYLPEELKKNEAVENLKQRNEFRKRFKRLKSAWTEEDELKYINKYDYEIEDAGLLQLLGNVSGQYVLYAFNGLVITDQYFIAAKTLIKIDTIKGILVFHNAEEVEKTYIYIFQEDSALLIDNKANRAELGWLIDVCYRLDVALECFGISNYLYEKEKYLYCRKCNSFNVKEKLLTLQCNSCGNKDYTSLGRLISFADVISSFRTRASGQLSSKEEEICLQDEVEHYAWIRDAYSNELNSLEVIAKKEVVNKMDEKQTNEEKKIVDETMFCPYCGKKILRTTKFCNFCGKQNNYGKEQ